MTANAKDMPRPDLLPLVYEADEVAALLAVTKSTVENLHRVGQLEGVKIGKHLRWRRADVLAFVDSLGDSSSNGGIQ